MHNTFCALSTLAGTAILDSGKAPAVYVVEHSFAPHQSLNGATETFDTQLLAEEHPHPLADLLHEEIDREDRERDEADAVASIPLLTRQRRRQASH